MWMATFEEISICKKYDSMEIATRLASQVSPTFSWVIAIRDVRGCPQSHWLVRMYAS